MHPHQRHARQRIALSRGPDASLESLPGVVLSDGLVLDRCESWVNLASELVTANAPGAWLVDLS